MSSAVDPLRLGRSAELETLEAGPTMLNKDRITAAIITELEGPAHCYGLLSPDEVIRIRKAVRTALSGNGTGPEHTPATAPLTVRDTLADLLETVFYDRGNNLANWPEDEAEAYRELGWSEGTAAARALVRRKAADVILAAGWQAPTTEPGAEPIGDEDREGDETRECTCDPQFTPDDPYERCICGCTRE